MRCNIDVAEQIGYPETDEAVLEGISMTTGSTNQAQAAAAVMTAAEALGYPLAVRQTMATIYNDASGGFGCNYGVTFPIESVLDADFEENDFLEWSSVTP